MNQSESPRRRLAACSFITLEHTHYTPGCKNPENPYFENYDYTREQLMLFPESGHPLSPATFCMVFKTL